MIGHYAMAAATAALRQTVERAVALAVNGASVTLRRPVSADASELGGPRANLYLYQAEPAAEQRNADLPFLAADGSLRGRPRIPYELRFLISFYGDDARYEPQLMAAKVLQALHASQPELSFDGTDELESALLLDTTPNASPDELRDELDSLRQQLVEDYLAMRRLGLHFFQVPLSVSELSQLWSFLFRAPYTLTIAWQCSAVWVEAASDIPSPPRVQQVKTRVISGTAAGEAP